MRLSFAKSIVVVWLVLLVAAAAVLTLTYAPRLAAQADVYYQLTGINSQTVQYGDYLNGAVSEGGKIVGRCNSNRTFTIDAEGTEYILASDIRVYTAATEQTNPANLITLCNAEGRVCAGVYADEGNDSVYHLTYRKDGQNFLFAPLQVYSVASNSPMAGTKVDTAANALQWTVTPRSVALAYRYDPVYGVDAAGEGDPYLGLPYAIEDGVMYLEHTYGEAADSILFTAAKGSSVVFGDELTVSDAVEGNDATTHAGDKALAAFDIDIRHGEDSVMQNYRFTSARATVDGTGYAMRVTPRNVAIASFHEDKTFASRRVDYANLYNDGDAIASIVSSGIFSYQQFSHEGNVVSGKFSSQALAKTVNVAQVGQVITVYYDVAATTEQLAAKLWDEVNGEPREGVVAITTDPADWAMSIVGWTVANADPNSEYQPSAADYVVAPAAAAEFTVSVQARAIVLYDSGHGGAPTDEREWVDVVAEHLAISLPYDDAGNLYTSPSVIYDLSLDGTPIELSFDVQALAEYFADPAHEDSIRLDAGTYNIVNPLVNDTHYTVEVNGSVRWTVTPVALGYADLTGRIEGAYSADATADGAARDMGVFLAALDTPLTSGICVKEYQYDGEATSHQFAFSFRDTTLDTEVTQKVSIGNGVDVLTPGYYAVAYEPDTDINYGIAADVIYMRVLPLTVTLVLPEGAIFDGTEHTASVRYGGSETNPFAPASENDEGWTVALSYRAGNREARPVDKGVYTVAVAVNGPEGSVGNPYLRYTGSSESFGIAAKAVTVTLRSNAVLSKTFGETVAENRLYYDKTGFVGTDDVTLTSTGLAASAEPGAKPITCTVTKGNPANYNVTLLGSSGTPNPTFLVNKIAVDAIKSYFDGFVADCVRAVATNSITLAPIAYRDIPITGVSYAYAGADGEWHSTGTTISNLKDGTLYHVRLVIEANGAYVDATQATPTAEVEVVTDIEVPVLAQDVLSTTSQSIVIAVRNYDRTKTYGCVVYPSGEGTPVNIFDKANGAPDATGVYTIGRAYSLTEGEDNLGRDVLLLDAPSDLESGSDYTVIVVVKTTDKEVKSAPLAVRTRAAAPVVAASALEVTDKSVTVPEGYYIYVAPLDTDDALPVAAVVPITMQQAGLTYAMLADSGAELTEEYLAEVTKGLQPNTTYVIAIWTEEDDLASAAQCFTFKTRVDNANRYRYTGFMLYFAQYLLVGLLGLIFICMLICAIRYAVLKKKLSGGNR